MLKPSKNRRDHNTNPYFWGDGIAVSSGGRDCIISTSQYATLHKAGKIKKHGFRNNKEIKLVCRMPRNKEAKIVVSQTHRSRKKDRCLWSLK